MVVRTQCQRIRAGCAIAASALVLLLSMRPRQVDAAVSIKVLAATGAAIAGAAWLVDRFLIDRSSPDSIGSVTLHVPADEPFTHSRHAIQGPQSITFTLPRAYFGSRFGNLRSLRGEVSFGMDFWSDSLDPVRMDGWIANGKCLAERPLNVQGKPDLAIFSRCMTDEHKQRHAHETPLHLEMFNSVNSFPEFEQQNLHRYRDALEARSDPGKFLHCELIEDRATGHAEVTFPPATVQILINELGANEPVSQEEISRQKLKGSGRPPPLTRPRLCERPDGSGGGMRADYTYFRQPDNLYRLEYGYEAVTYLFRSDGSLIYRVEGGRGSKSDSGGFMTIHYKGWHGRMMVQGRDKARWPFLHHQAMKFLDRHVSKITITDNQQRTF